MIAVRGGSRAVDAGNEPGVVCVILKRDGWSRNRAVGICDLRQIAIQLVVKFYYLAFLINRLLQPTGGWIIGVGHARTVGVPLLHSTSLDVMFPNSGFPHRIRQTVQCAAAA